MHIGAEQIVKLCDVEQTSCAVGQQPEDSTTAANLCQISQAWANLSVVGVVTDVIQSCVDSP